MNKKTDIVVVKCKECGRDVKLIKHVNKCECGARYKVLNY